MITESIRDIMEFLFGVKDSYTLDEYASVEVLTINRFDISGEIIDVDFSDLLKFPNLKTLTINQCELDSGIMQIIMSIPNLKNLSLYNCELADNPYEFFNNLVLFNLDIDNTVFDLSLLKKQYDSIILSNIVIDKPISFDVNYLDISHCVIKDFSFLINSNISTLVVSMNQNQLPEIANYLGHKKIMANNGVMVEGEVNN